MEYESLLRATGGFGRLQYVEFFSLGMLCFKAIAELQLLVLSLVTPEFRCLQQNTSHYEAQDFGAHCQILRLGNESLNGTVEQCHEFEYRHNYMERTIVEHYNLVCGRQWYATLLNSMYLLGVSVGVVLSTLGDRIGRKKVFYGAGALDFVTTVLPLFMPDIGTQIVARFLKGIPTPIYSQGLLLLQEFTMEQHRGRVANAYWMFWCCGFMASGVLAFWLQHWQRIQLFSLAFCASYPIIYIFVPESPRWLVLKGRGNEAIKVFRHVAKFNGVNWTPGRELEIVPEEQPTGQIQELFAYTQIRKKTIIICLMMLVQSFCYFGISIDTAFITSNVFVNTAISGALEAPSYLLGAIVCDRLGRRLPTLAMTAMSGVCIVATALIPTSGWTQYLQIPVAVIAKILLTAAFSVMGILSIELFPTSVRTSGMYMAILLGSVVNTLSPVILNLGRVQHYLPGVLFGSIAVLSSSAVYFLPETRGLPMAETVPQSEGLVRGREQEWGEQVISGALQAAESGDRAGKANAVAPLQG